MATNNMTIGEVEMIRMTVSCLRHEGYTLLGVNDGEENIKTTDLETALDIINSVEDSTLYMQGGEGASPRRIAMYIVLGNAEDGSETIADCTDCIQMERAAKYAEEHLQFVVESAIELQKWIKARDAAE